jgi:hypothetical protein
MVCGNLETIDRSRAVLEMSPLLIAKRHLLSASSRVGSTDDFSYRDRIAKFWALELVKIATSPVRRTHAHFGPTLRRM